MTKQVSRVRLTAGRVSSFACPPDKAQAFLWDTDTPALALRVTPTGRKTYVFESRLNGSTIRVSVGTVTDWSIEQARIRAQELKRMVDSGTDPREVAREQLQAKAAELAQADADRQRKTLTGLQAWTEYVLEGRTVGFTSRGPWSDRHHADHLALSDAGGVPLRRGKGNTKAGPLYALLSQPLVNIDAQAVAAWMKEENQSRPARAALGFRLLRGFLNWCGEHAEYRSIAHSDSHKPKDVRRLVRTQAPKEDALQREHLPAWFKAVRADSNVKVSAYLQTVLLTGARKSEIASLRWTDVDFRFGGSLTIRDKVDGTRVIPCPIYVAQLLAALPRRGPWVFGHDKEPPKIASNAIYNHRNALNAGGLPHVSLHGLRRSFGTLAEWVECPAGVVAQIQGHKPSATAEKHYRARPIDLLRVWHEKIVTWVLEQAGVEFDRNAPVGKLRAVG